MIPDWARRPEPGSSGWALARLRRFVWLRNHDSAYRHVPAVRKMVNAAILSTWRDIRDLRDAEASREASRLLTPAAVRR